MKRYLEDDGYVWRTDYGGNRLYICDVSDKEQVKQMSETVIDTFSKINSRRHSFHNDWAPQHSRSC